MGLVSISVPREKLEEEVDKLTAEVAEIPSDKKLHSNICLNTALKIQGIDTLLDCYGQMNRFDRLVYK